MVLFILIAGFISLLTFYILAIEFPSLISIVDSYVDAILHYVSQGLDIVWIFVPKTVTIALMTLAISIEVIYLGYLFVMWILKKLPMGGIH